MYLRRIELQGFKTFPKRTTVDLPRGITAVVGPNGAGKSNLADAVRWALGEQAPRSLRIRRAEDVIFAGSESRGRTGMAEVLLTFDNTDGWLPTEFTEVVIGRRLFRSGDVEYLMNGSRVRLRDIVDLMAAGGASSSGHSIISQGEVDQALQQKPEDRRAFLEQAAGVARFYARRDQAERRLTETRRNLDRVLDLVAELEPRVELLRAQADVATRGRELERELGAAQVTLARHRLFTVTRQLKAAEAREAEAAEAMAAITAEPVEQLRQQATAADLMAKEADTSLRELRSAAVSARERASALRAQRDLLGERIRNAQARIGEATERLATAEAQAAGAVEYESAARASLAEIVLQIEAITAERDELRTVISSGPRSAAQLASVREKLGAARDEAARLRERERQAGVELARTGAQLEHAIGETRAQRQRADGAAAVAAQARRDADMAANALDTATAAQRAANERLAGALGELGEAEKLEATQTQRLEALRAEQEALRRLQEQIGTPDDAFKALRQSEARAGIVGRIRDAFEPDHRAAATLLDAALGAALNDVLLSGPADAPGVRSAAEALRLGHIRLRPTKGFHGWPYETSGEAPNGDGILGPLSNMVRVKRSAPELARRLLDGVLVTEDLQAALRARQGRPEAARWIFVTMQGDAIDPDGAIRVGRVAGGLSDISARIDEINLDSERTESARGEAQAAIERRRAAATKARGEREQAEEALTASKDTYLRAHVVAAETARQHQQLDTRAAATAERQQDLREQSRELEQTISRVRPQLADLDQRIAKLAARADAEQASIGASPAEVRLAALDASLASAEQRREDLEHRSERQALQAQSAQAEVERCRAVIAELEAALATSHAEAGETRDALVAAEASAAAAEASAREAETASMEVRLEVQRLQMRVSQRQWEQRRVESELSAAQAETERLVERRNELRRSAHEELGLTELTSAKSEQPVGRLERRVSELRRLLLKLGPVNPLAPDEYRRERARLRDSQTQIADLEGAETNLRALSADLRRQLHHEFMSTFESINKAFSRLFAEMFGGGEAEMVLTAPTDVEQTGVEIHVRVPGKRKQELAALSGGERALVSAALILALLHTRPSPFCVLDEVDAALDEDNVGRFCRQVESLSDRTQFVLITHNAVTVQAADTIYGATMKDAGVTQILSLPTDTWSENEQTGNGRAARPVRAAEARRAN